jgi:hypothetical protein
MKKVKSLFLVEKKTYKIVATVSILLVEIGSEEQSDGHPTQVIYLFLLQVPRHVHNSYTFFLNLISTQPLLEFNY